MAAVEDSKKRKNAVEEYDVSGDDDTMTPETMSSSAGSGASSGGLNLIMEQLLAMQQTAANTKTEENNWRLVQNENHTRTTSEIATLSTSIKGIDVKVGTLQADFLSLKGRVCALESGGQGSKGKGKATAPSTPRGSGDPWSAPGADPWQQYNPGDQDTKEAPPTNLTPSTSNNYALDQRIGNRSTLIFGGFPRDTCRADLEQALREFVNGHEGILRVGSLGKYGNTGRVNFKCNKTMWNFILANKGGKKFDYEGAEGTIWFTIEKTENGRIIAKKVGYLVKT